MSPGDLRAAFLRKPWHRFLNTSGGTIPPYAVMKVTGCARSHGDIRFTVEQPDSSTDAFYLVNGPQSVADTQEGLCTTLTQAGIVRYDSNDGTPAVGQEWGPESGSWSVHIDGTGFSIGGGARALDDGSTCVVAVQISSGTSSSVTELVQVWHSGNAVGDEVIANADGYHSARIRRWSDPNMATLSSVWLRFVDQHDRLDGQSTGPSMVFQGDFHGPCRFSGFATSDGSTRPVYVVKSGDIQESIGFHLNEAMGESEDLAASAIVDYSNDVDAALDAVVTVFDDLDLFPKALNEAYGWAVRNRSLDYRTGSFEAYWQVWVCDQMTITGEATLSGGGMDAGDFRVEINSFRNWGRPPYGQHPVPEPEEAFNPRRHMGEGGDEVTLIWGRVLDIEAEEPEEVEGWIVVDVTLKKTFVIFDMRIKADKSSIEALTTECAVEYREPPTWVPKIPLEQCEN